MNVNTDTDVEGYTTDNIGIKSEIFMFICQIFIFYSDL